MDCSPLSLLPGEIRMRIYELLLVEETCVRYRPSSARLQNKISTHALALLRTCKQIHDESHHVFYAGNIFQLDAAYCEVATALSDFKNDVGDRNAALLRNIQVDKGELYPANMEWQLETGLLDLEVYRGEFAGKCTFSLLFCTRLDDGINPLRCGLKAGSQSSMQQSISTCMAQIAEARVPRRLSSVSFPLICPLSARALRRLANLERVLPGLLEIYDDESEVGEQGKGVEQ